MLFRSVHIHRVLVVKLEPFRGRLIGRRVVHDFVENDDAIRPCHQRRQHWDEQENLSGALYGSVEQDSGQKAPEKTALPATTASVKRSREHNKDIVFPLGKIEPSVVLQMAIKPVRGKAGGFFKGARLLEEMSGARHDAHFFRALQFAEGLLI